MLDPAAQPERAVLNLGQAGYQRWLHGISLANWGTSLTAVRFASCPRSRTAR